MSTVLVVAQPFGFGPASIASKLSKLLKPHVKKLGYVGEGLSLDLQSDADYHSIEHCSIMEDKERFKQICGSYDVLVAVCDFEAAHIAKVECGKHVIMFDSLAWFWPEIHPITRHLDLYLAQDFFGVRDRITSSQDRMAFPPFTYIVPALVSVSPDEDCTDDDDDDDDDDDAPNPAEFTQTSSSMASSASSSVASSAASSRAQSPLPFAKMAFRKRDAARDDLLLINFGGLLNPLFDDELLVQYARTILTALNESGVVHQFEKCVVLGSRKIAAGLGDCGFTVETREPADVCALLKRCKLVFMTPGLGNMCDAAFAAAPVVWLPPTNASQGLQLRLLRQHDSNTVGTEWHDFMEDDGPAKFADDENAVDLWRDTMQRFTQTPRLVENYAKVVRRLIDKFPNGASPCILTKFGCNGCDVIADIIVDKLNAIQKQQTQDTRQN